MARRRKPADEPKRTAPSLSLQGAGAIGPAGPGGAPAGVQLEGNALAVELDARALCDVMRRAVLAEVSDQIREGRRPDGGPQRPLSKRAAADPARESQHRGFRTGVLVDELRATPIRGDAGRAESNVLPPTTRNAFIAQEAARGVTYLAIGPATTAAATRAADEAVAAMLEGRRVEAEQGSPEAREERAA